MDSGSIDGFIKWLYIRLFTNNMFSRATSGSPSKLGRIAEMSKFTLASLDLRRAGCYARQQLALEQAELRSVGRSRVVPAPIQWRPVFFARVPGAHVTPLMVSPNLWTTKREK